MLKRRTARFVPAPAAAISKAAPKQQSKENDVKQAEPAPVRRGSISGDNASREATPQAGPASNTLKKSDSKPNLKRDSSDIFKSFAKAKAKPKDVKSKESTPAPAEDGMFSNYHQRSDPNLCRTDARHVRR